MQSVKVICRRDRDLGFALAGVDTEGCQTPDEARGAVRRALEREDLGVLLIDEALAGAFDARLLRVLEASEQPLVIIVPLEVSAEAAREYLERAIQRLIGYQVKLK